MTEHDPFERDLGRSMEPHPAPADLQRRIARIPLEHPRPRGERRLSPWRRWLTAGSAPWAASMTAAFASLAVGFWLGFSGIGDSDTTVAGNDEDLVALVFPSTPITMGEEQ
jgi:hypothetical protein